MDVRIHQRPSRKPSLSRRRTNAKPQLQRCCHYMGWKQKLEPLEASSCHRLNQKQRWHHERCQTELSGVTLCPDATEVQAQPSCSWVPCQATKRCHCRSSSMHPRNCGTTWTTFVNLWPLKLLENPLRDLACILLQWPENSSNPWPLWSSQLYTQVNQLWN